MECLATLYERSIQSFKAGKDLVEVGIARYFVTERVFTEEAKELASLSESVIVSRLVRESKDLISQGVSPEEYMRSNLLTEQIFLASAEPPKGNTILDDSDQEDSLDSWEPLPSKVGT